MLDKKSLIGLTVEEAREVTLAHGLDIKVCGANIPVALNESTLKVDVWVDKDGKIYKA